MSHNAYLLPSCVIEIDGQSASSEFMDSLTRITVESSLNIPAVATLFLDSPSLGRPLTWIDSESYDPGKKLVVKLGYGSDASKVFDGEIVELEPSFGGAGVRLVIRAFDLLHRLSRGRKVKSFLNMTDQDIISQVLSAHAMTFQYTNSKGPGQVHEQVVQNSQTDLDFVRSRAALIGCHCYAAGATVHCVAPKQGSPVATIDEGSLISFRPRLTTVDQVSKVTVRGWKQKTKEAVVGTFEGASVTDTVEVNRKNGAKFVATTPDGTQEHLVTDWVVDNQDQAQYIAEALATSLSGRFVQAEGVTIGFAGIAAGTWIAIKDVGDRYSGTFFVTNALHQFDARSGYNTEYTISGHDPTTLLHLLNAESNEAARGGLQIGVVTEVDPKIAAAKVQLPHLGDAAVTNWARVAAPGAGNARGMQFLPEVGDEVIVGFERGDINFPFILGGLWNGKDAPPTQVALESTKVAARVITSRSGHVITFEDKEDGGGIIIKDSKGDTITISAKDTSITIESKKDIIVKATGDLKMTATGDVKVSGMNVNLEGQVGVSLKGTQVKVNGDAETEIKGGIVKIN
ncbi:MAG: VgrG-related protein [Thermomicrobia bacterium]|nr:VgrG-related protein [Thermomicrobia bacterium]